jgi:hypothetical protein
MKRCAVCGAENDDWRPMCVRCGASFSGAAAEPVAGPAAGASGGAGTPAPVFLPPPPGGPPRTGNSPKTVAVAIVVSVAIVAAALVGVTAVGSKKKASAPTTTFPSTWDPRVINLVQFDAKARGLDYLHPARVVFLSRAAFRKRLLGAEKPTAKERRELEAYTEAFRAIGLVQGEVDLFAEQNRLEGELTEAFYDPETKEIVIPEGAIDVEQKVTLAHELTHTLDDEHFDLAKIDKSGTKHDTDAGDALVEGDAVAVQNDYIAKLSPTDQRAYLRSQDTASSNADIKGVPQVLGLLQEWPYDFGPLYVSVLRTVGGQAKVNAAFRSPPIDQEQVIDPLSYLDGDQPGAISLPALPKGAKKIDSGKEFGLLQWYLMLSERIDPHVAMHASLGWGADSWLIDHEGARTCIRVHYRGETRRDDTEMLGALRQWIAALPRGMATVTANADDTLSLRSCDPGTGAKTVTNRSLGAYQLLAFRSDLVAEFAKAGATPAIATCAADTITDQTSVADVASGSGPPVLRDAARLHQIGADCALSTSTVVPRDEIDNR